MGVLNFSSKRGQNEIHSDFAEREKIQGLKNLNVPNLRFGEYSDEWNLTELQKVATISKGSGISKDQLSENGTYCILYGELYTKYNSEIISEVYSKTELDAANLVKSKENDVIIPCSGETAIDISTARCVPFNGILLGGDLNIIRLKNQNGGFFAYQLNGKRKVDIAKVAQGVSVVHLYGGHLKQVKIAYPTYSEQKKIADFLSLLDSRIATQNKIIEDLKKLKVAIRDNQLNIIRKQYGLNSQISELLDYEQPSKYIVSNTEYLNDNNLIPVLTANKAFILGYTDETFGIYDKGQCIILDDFTLDCKLVSFAFKVKSSAIKILTSKNGISLRYIYEYINYIGLETAEHKRHYISEIEPMLIAYPDDNDIVNSFCILMEIYDKKIEIENKYLQSLLSQKAYLLSNMFI